MRAIPVDVLDWGERARFSPLVSVRALLFDYGGTLDGEASHWLDRFVALYREAGVERPFDDIKSAFYQADAAAYADPRMAHASLHELMDAHVAVQLRALRLDNAGLHPLLVDRFTTRSHAALAASRSTLTVLRRRFSLGVVSNFYGNVDRILADVHIAPLLSVIVDSTRVGVSKPDPRIYEHAIAALRLEPAQVLHVGDSYERDVLAAARAGLRTAWLVGERDLVAPEVDPEPDIRLRSLDELVAYLDAV